MTDFVLIGIFQTRENYGAHNWDGNGSCPQAWKFKGSVEHILGSLTDEEISNIGSDGIRELASFASKSFEEFNDYFESYIIDYVFVHVNSDLVNKVSNLIPEYPNDPYAYIGIAIDLGVTEYEVMEAMNILNADRSGS